MINSIVARGVALAALLAACGCLSSCSDTHTGTTSASVRTDGPLVVPPGHGWSWSAPVGQTFTDGLEVLELEGEQRITIDRVELVGDEELELVGAMIAPPPRRIAAAQVFDRWPPQGDRVFDPDTLVEAEGAEIGSSSASDNKMGWELLLGIRPTEPGTHRRTSIRIFYAVDGEDYVAELPAELVVCAGQRSGSRCAAGAD